MPLTIAVANGAHGAQSRTLEPGRYLIGRSPECDISFSGAGAESVSWNHAEIHVRSDGAFLKDLQSSNGTWLNGRRIPVDTKVLDGDEIRLGQTGPALRVEQCGSDAVAAAALDGRAAAHASSAAALDGRAAAHASTAAAPQAAKSAQGAAGPLAFGGGTGISASPFTGPESRPLPPALPGGNPGTAAARDGRAAAHASSAAAKPPEFRAAQASATSTESAAGERRSSTTRALLVRLQKSQRGWRGFGVAAMICLCVAMVVSLALFAARQTADAKKRDELAKKADKENRKLAREADELKGQTKKLSGETQKLHTAIATRPKSDFDTKAIFAANGDCVYLVGAVRGTSVFPVGTAFAVDASGVFGTNAHVTVAVKQILAKNIPLYVIGEAGKVQYKILSVKTHPDYRELTQPNTYVPDVGTLKVELPAGTKLKTVTLADESDLKDLGDGSKLCYIGFPSYLSNDFRDIGQVKARINPGNVVRMLTLQGKVGTRKDQLILEHNMMAWGGASGSPIFNARGHVVGLHFSSSRVETEMITIGPDRKPVKTKVILGRSPSSTKYGIRADKLKELLK